jgi:histidyl-tRNA synthetase
MHDLLPGDHQKHAFIITKALQIAARYGFCEISTPMLEFKEVFKRTLGTTSDIISKEMYEMASKGGEELVLRPEGTAGVARAVLSNGLTQSMPLKFCYTGPMFRYERPQKGRLRQFHHIGIELFGVDSALGDVEVVSLAYDVLKALHLEERVTLEINTLGDEESRTHYRTQLVAYLNDHLTKLSPDSQTRLTRNPLRILDSKDEGDKRILENAPLLKESLNTASEDMFASVQEGLQTLKIPFRINPHLVRGLDYYCHLAFEFTTTDLGSQGTVLAGGRYDGLTRTMGGPQIPGVGWAGGIERLAMMLREEDLPRPVRPLAVIAMEERFSFKGLELAEVLRQEGFRVDMTYENNLGKCLKKSNKINALYALIVGEEEVRSHKVTCKNLDSGEQMLVPQEEIGQFFKDTYPQGRTGHES